MVCVVQASVTVWRIKVYFVFYSGGLAVRITNIPCTAGRMAINRKCKASK